MRVLDLYCGPGGAGTGYHLAGHEVVGVDIAPQPRYPFRFIQADALTFPLAGFDFIHASPPCQFYTPLRAVAKKDYPDLVAPTRARLMESGVPWVMENVVQAPLRRDAILCGAMFGLRVYRHRAFECSFPVAAPAHPRHVVRATGTQRNRKAHYLAGGFITITGDVGTYCGDAMGIDWMNGNELSQAIPPAYTRWIADQIPNGGEGNDTALLVRGGAARMAIYRPHAVGRD